MIARVRRAHAAVLTVSTVLAVLAGLLLVVPVPAAQADDAASCDTVRVRPNAASLTQQQWDDLLDAIVALQDGPGHYNAFVTTHGQAAAQVGNRPVQLPFLRALLASFEDALRAIDPDVVLPYWDLGASAQAPELGPVWGPDRLGGNGSPADAVVRDGRFKHWLPTVPDVHLLTREWSAGDGIGAFPSPEATAAQLAAADSYGAMRQVLSLLQGFAHAGIGGDLATQYAPNDPVFWFVAADIDRLWAGWQSEHAPGAYGGQNANGSAAQLSDQVPGFPGTTVGDTLETSSYCYTYGLAIDPLSLGDGVAGLPYDAQLSAAPSATATTTYAVTSGTLPPGLTLSPSGALTGTPTAAGAATFTVAAADSASGRSGKRTYVLTVGSVSGISVTAPSSAVAGEPVDLNATALVGSDPVGDVTAGTTFSTGSAGASCTAGTCTFTKAGSVQVTGSYAGHADTVQIAVLPAAPAAVVAVSGRLQQVDPGQTFAAPFVARVQDAYGNPVSDRTVEFTVPSGWGASFPGGATAFSSGSHEDGTVTSPLLTAGTRTGLLTVMARVSGILDPAAFTVVVRAPAPPRADLGVRVLGPDRARRGRPVALRVVVTNQGPATTRATARVVLPKRWGVRSAGGGTRQGRLVRIPVGPLAAGQQAVVRIRVVPRGKPGVRPVRASLVAPLADPDGSDDVAVKRIRVRR